MTIVQILALARRKILENTEEIFDNATLLLYANMRKDEIAKRYLGKRIIKRSSLSFSSGSVTRPTDWNGHYYSSDSQTPNTGNEFKLVNIEDFQAGVYPQMICESEGNILVFPTTTGSIYTWYYKKLADMSLDPVVDPPTELDDAFHRPMVYGIVADCFEDAQDFELSKFFTDKFEAELERASQTVSQLEESSQEAGALLSPLPDLGFSGYGAGGNDPNRW